MSIIACGFEFNLTLLGKNTLTLKVFMTSYALASVNTQDLCIF